MVNTTNFLLTTPSSAAPMMRSRTPRRSNSTDLFKIELNRRMDLKLTQQQDENAEPHDEMCPSSVKDFGLESYLTPRRSIRDSELSLDMPPPPRKIDHCDKKNYLKVKREELQTASIMMPSIGSKKYNQAISPLSRKTTLFRLQPREECTCHSPPKLKRKIALQDSPGFNLRRQTKNATKSKINLNTLQAGKLSYKHFPSVGHLQANAIGLNRMERSQSYTALSA
mmetsp:Transcript_35762/g.42723  ORF Transcript_35762/g.42723 Transcript_35762/m.42723 type:complete len:225 (+) Transcript_35762:91-765(+)